jgi:hypothetical protein
MQTDQLTPRQLIAVVLAVLFFLISLGIYTARANPFAQKATTSQELTITNPLVLENWLPASVYRYTQARLTDYANSQQLDTSAISVVGPVINENGTYGFTVTFNPNPEKYRVNVLVSNFDSVVSTSVSIDGIKQTVLVPTTDGDTTYSGFDSLINRGLSSIQAVGIQTALQKFSPGAGSMVVDPSNITTESTHDGGVFRQLMSFDIAISGKDYSAEVDYTDVSTVYLRLHDPSTHKLIFSSGKVEPND